MNLPARLTLNDFAYALDGGSIWIEAFDEAGERHEITLGQYAWPEPDSGEGLVPGRLCFDKELIEMRSEEEAQLLNLLRHAKIDSPHSGSGEEGPRELAPNQMVVGDDIKNVLTRGPEENIDALRNEVIEFVESDEYL